MDDELHDPVDKDFKKVWLKQLRRPGIGRIIDMEHTPGRRMFRIFATLLDKEYGDIEKKLAESNMELEGLKEELKILKEEIEAYRNGNVSRPRKKKF